MSTPILRELLADIDDVEDGKLAAIPSATLARARQAASRQDRALCPDFGLRGKVYEIWTDPTCPSNRRLVDPHTREDVDTDSAFNPPLSNDELLAIYDYGKGY